MAMSQENSVNGKRVPLMPFAGSWMNGTSAVAIFPHRGLPRKDDGSGRAEVYSSILDCIPNRLDPAEGADVTH